ncbi:MAG: hypothetical protein KatS3mg099_047 [Candidatus Parcubacteria bacterium]|nr:MAG: hypothetical protein KatS3mg099_047 [Candidatus Parcubacteria bacterium]
MAQHAGHIHPLSQAISRAVRIWSDMGFRQARGPLIETQWYNFDALNVPQDHPARDMQDTFYLKDNPEYVLRTHTSPVQIRALEKWGAPLRAIAPGRVFRNEATDATHEAQFFQLEGLAVDAYGTITLAHLKGALLHFFQRFFERDDIQVRFRPGYFPFVEPGVEVDMYLTRADGSGRWLELMGAGMVHPTVLKNAGVDPARYSGFAFGVGLERLVAVRYGIEDVRYFHSGDVRFVAQF